MTQRPSLWSRIAVWSTCLAVMWSVVTVTQSAGTALADPQETAAASTPSDAVPSVTGMVVYKSGYPFAETLSRVQDQLGSIGKVATTVDFARTAQWIGKQLRPTTLVIGGSPKASAPIMAASQRAAIDLPQKYLVWQAAGGTVFLAYNSANYVAACAGIDPSNGAMDGLRNGSESIAEAATGSTAPVGDGGSASCAGSLIQKVSNTTVPDAIARYQAAFALNSQPTVLTVDQAADAASAGTPIPPTELTLTDDATVSVALVGAQQTTGIDLPQRFVAWQDDAGAVHVGHPDIRALAARHQVTGQDSVLDIATTSSNYFTSKAAGGPNASG
jgi:uncharacterized protein (DUF302 family)